MPPHHPRLPPPLLLPRRLLSTTWPRLLPSDRSQVPSEPPTIVPAPVDDDFYSLLLSQPLTYPAPKSINKHQALKASNFLSDSNSPPISTTEMEKDPPKISFSMPLAGPSARMRGLTRGEKGLDRPPEPDNCCMSGCVNCVWEAYREEVEEWALAKRRREQEGRREQGMRDHANVRYVGRGKERVRVAGEDVEGGIGDLDEVGAGGFEGVDLDQEGLFDEVPVGMREFMATEKRLRERKQRRLATGEG